MYMGYALAVKPLLSVLVAPKGWRAGSGIQIPVGYFIATTSSQKHFCLENPLKPQANGARSCAIQLPVTK